MTTAQLQAFDAGLATLKTDTDALAAASAELDAANAAQVAAQVNFDAAKGVVQTDVNNVVGLAMDAGLTITLPPSAGTAAPLTP